MLPATSNSRRLNSSWWLTSLAWLAALFTFHFHRLCRVEVAAFTGCSRSREINQFWSILRTNRAGSCRLNLGQGHRRLLGLGHPRLLGLGLDLDQGHRRLLGLDLGLGHSRLLLGLGLGHSRLLLGLG